MKKAGLLLIFLLFLNILALTLIQTNLTKAQETPPGLPPQLAQDPQELIEKAKNQTQTSTEYLKQEWKKMLSNTPVIGPIITVLDKIFTALNPIFKVILGVDYGLCWAFIFALMLWIILVVIIYYPAWGLFNSKPLGLLVAIASSSLIGISKVIKKAADLLVIMITKRWLFWISLILTILIGIIIWKLESDFFKKLKEEAEKVKTEEAQKTTQAMGKVAKKELEGYTKDKD